MIKILVKVIYLMFPSTFISVMVEFLSAISKICDILLSLILTPSFTVLNNTMIEEKKRIIYETKF